MCVESLWKKVYLLKFCFFFNKRRKSYSSSKLFCATKQTQQVILDQRIFMQMCAHYTNIIYLLSVAQLFVPTEALAPLTDCLLPQPTKAELFRAVNWEGFWLAYAMCLVVFSRRFFSWKSMPAFAWLLSDAAASTKDQLTTRNHWRCYLVYFHLSSSSCQFFLDQNTF